MTSGSAPTPFEVFEVDRHRLVEDEELLVSIYSVLSVAHYRTSPNDLQMLLEAPGHRVFAAKLDGYIVGAVEVCVEPRVGSRGLGVVPDIFSRMGWPEPGRGFRVVRIAVVPCLQGRGIGSSLLRFVEDVARREGLDWVAASFGHHEPLPFWVKNGYVPVHVSPRFNPATGEKNIVVMKPLSSKAEYAVRVAACSLLNRLVFSGSSIFRDVGAETLAWLLKSIPICKQQVLLDDESLTRLKLFLEGKLAFESVHDVLLRLIPLLNSEGVLAKLEYNDLVLLSLVIVQGKPIHEAQKLLGLEPRLVDEKLRRIYALLKL